MPQTFHESVWKPRPLIEICLTSKEYALLLRKLFLDYVFLTNGDSIYFILMS